MKIKKEFGKTKEIKSASPYIEATYLNSLE